MSEGGLFPWKLQKLMQRGPMGNYSSIHKPLPPPPAGQEWYHDEKTKEWKLIAKKQAATAIATEEPPPFVPAVPMVTPPRSPPMKKCAPTTTATATVSEVIEPEFAEEKTDIVVGLPTDDIMTVTAGGGGGGSGGGWCNASANSSSHRSEDEWELLSAAGRSNCGSGSGNGSNSHHTGNTSGSMNNAVFVAKAGSVRSITTLECYEHSPGQGGVGTLANVCVPFKIQRTNSNSTIDSNENNNNNSLGPSGKGILGVDYVEHVILPTDTLQGICIAYKISSMRLRQANHFSGNSLVLAPKKLVIPLSKKALRSGFIRVQDTDAKEYKLYSFLAEFPDLGMTEAKAYLELADWILNDAIRSAKEDHEWEREMDDSTVLRSGQIRITMDNKRGCLYTQGAGINKRNNTPTQQGNNTGAAAPKDTTVAAAGSSTAAHVKESSEDRAVSGASVTSMFAKGATTTPKPGVMPAIATKTVQPEDLYRASAQHANFGVELKSLGSSSSSSNNKT